MMKLYQKLMVEQIGMTLEVLMMILIVVMSSEQWL